jgi:hypothetical protein
MIIHYMDSLQRQTLCLTFFLGLQALFQQTASYEHSDSESNAGYFARKLFQEQMDGMIIGINAHEKTKILAALTNKGEFRSYQFENE